MGEQGKRPSDVLAAQLPRIRNRLELTAQQLADRIADMGGSLDRAAISKIEVGKRGVSLDEAIEIAAALGIAPIHLFLPRDDGAPVCVAPDLEVPAAQARAWVRGYEPLEGMDERTYRIEVPASELPGGREAELSEEDVAALKRLLSVFEEFDGRFGSAGRQAGKRAESS
jgi:transcriptional regulator with XRE-family HTH domain